jgi:DNA polymerase
MLVGEQPGDEEDLSGEPFVGPAGRVLDRALATIGLSRADVYVTNAVKHFKWEPRGKRRLHRKPKASEIAACSCWLAQEIDHVRPAVIAALGTTALQALTGSAQSLTAARQLRLVHGGGARIVPTYHPSAVLRAPDEQGRSQLFDQLCRDLKAALRLA